MMSDVGSWHKLSISCPSFIEKMECVAVVVVVHLYVSSVENVASIYVALRFGLMLHSHLLLFSHD